MTDRRRPLHFDPGRGDVTGCGRSLDRTRSTRDLAQVQCSTCYVAAVATIARPSAATKPPQASKP